MFHFKIYMQPQSNI